MKRTPRPMLAGLFLLACTSCTPAVPGAPTAAPAADRPVEGGYHVAAVTFGRDKLKGSTKTQGDPNQALKFQVDLEESLDGAERLIVLPGVRHIDGVPGLYAKDDGVVFRYRPGRQKPGKFMIDVDDKGVAAATGWVKSQALRKSVSVIFHDDAGAEAGRITFYDCFPVKWVGPSLNAKNSGHANEELEVSYQSMEFIKRLTRGEPK